MGSRPLRPEDPRRLGEFQLIARLGEGGMGVVFLGRDTAGRSVAVKTVRAEYADREEFRARFRSEVHRVRQVPSFCTAAVIDADPDSEVPYLVVEYVDGPSLQDVVTERGPVPAGDVHSVAVGVAAALSAIHGAGVIHRDLKPSNVLLSLGLPKVIDFGIARALDVTSRHTRTDQMVGTVAYMAPERLDPTVGEITPAADIFAWGAVVTYAGTGHSPFKGDSPMATAGRILTAEPDLTGLPESLAGLVGLALSKHPADRPAAGDLVQRLLAVPAPAPAPVSRPAPSRYGARDLLEQLIAEAPQPAAGWAGRAQSATTDRPGTAPPGTIDRPAGGQHAAPDQPTGRQHATVDRPGRGGPMAAGPVSGQPGTDRPTSGPPADGRHAAGPANGARFGARDLLEGLVSAPVQAQPASPPPARPHQSAGTAPAEQPRKPVMRRALYAAVAIAVAIVAGATVALARTNDNDEPTGAAAGPPPSPAASADGLSFAGPSLFDPLTEPAQFPPSSTEAGSCAYQGGALRARTTGRVTYQCLGPADTFAGDLVINVDLTVGTANSCAMVWFRHQSASSYQLSACADRQVMEIVDGAILSTTGRKQSAALQPGTKHKLTVTVTGQSVSVAVDGSDVLRAGSGNAELVSGQVLLGVATGDQTGTADVSFANLDVRATS
ncbi:serine/threonine protein kinase [Actinoplanes sp. NPDC049265]|uniref:serine/threonine protein kinase n=1 Tax=Actinoplanes sp. NPDC049265 TaxID=3363902 RepID=UPI003715312F